MCENRVDSKSIIREVYRVLKPNGVVVTETFDENGKIKSIRAYKG